MKRARHLGLLAIVAAASASAASLPAAYYPLLEA